MLANFRTLSAAAAETEKDRRIRQLKQTLGRKSLNCFSFRALAHLAF
jgi:hypothetical protein